MAACLFASVSFSVNPTSSIRSVSVHRPGLYVCLEIDHVCCLLERKTEGLARYGQDEPRVHCIQCMSVSVHVTRTRTPTDGLAAIAACRPPGTHPSIHSSIHPSTNTQRTRCHNQTAAVPLLPWLLSGRGWSRTQCRRPCRSPTAQPAALGESRAARQDRRHSCPDTLPRQPDRLRKGHMTR